ncbi:MAG: hypothetical protein JNL83_17300 [Myxococcales bacterium]|nr:hypothetical protein [Myxococcales bacterium]
MRVLAVLLALAACRSDQPAPTIDFRSSATSCPALTCARIGEAGAAATVSFAGDDLVVAASGLPDGSTIAIGERTSASEIRVPIGDVLHRLTIRQVVGADEIDFGLRLTVTLAGAKPATAPVPPIKLGTQLVARLATVTRGPVLFANEAPPVPRRTIVLAEPGDHIVFGPAKLLEDIDWIAVPVDGETEATLTLYERRTGKVIETKTFAAQPDRNVMKAWLAERVEQP